MGDVSSNDGVPQFIKPEPNDVAHIAEVNNHINNFGNLKKTSIFAVSARKISFVIFGFEFDMLEFS